MIDMSHQFSELQLSYKYKQLLSCHVYLLLFPYLPFPILNRIAQSLVAYTISLATNPLHIQLSLRPNLAVSDSSLT